jgi:hypothetical protein
MTERKKRRLKKILRTVFRVLYPGYVSGLLTLIVLA